MPEGLEIEILLFGNFKKAVMTWAIETPTFCYSYGQAHEEVTQLREKNDLLQDSARKKHRRRLGANDASTF